jgi:transposase
MVSRNRKYARKTVIAAINLNGYLRPSRIFDKGSITTGQFVQYVRDDLAPHLKKGDVVIWDLLGRSGRAKNPTALHFAPEARAAIERQGARLLLLPPAGKLFNPIESVFGETKRLYERIVGKVGRPSSLTFHELCAAWHNAEDQTSVDTFKHAYHERANGKEFERVCREKDLM